MLEMVLGNSEAPDDLGLYVKEASGSPLNENGAVMETRKMRCQESSQSYGWPKSMEFDPDIVLIREAGDVFAIVRVKIFVRRMRLKAILEETWKED